MNFNYMIFNSRIRKFLINVGINTIDDIHKASVTIYEICIYYHYNEHLPPSDKTLRISQEIKEYYPKINGNQMYQIYQNSFNIGNNLDQANIKISKELMLLYDCLARRNTVDLIPNFDSLKSMVKLNIEEKAEKNKFSKGLTQQLVDNSHIIVYLDNNLKKINETSTIDPEVIVTEINIHITSLLPQFKGNSVHWREELFLHVFKTWNRYFTDYKYECIDSMLTFFFEKCSIFTNTISMDDTKTIQEIK